MSSEPLTGAKPQSSIEGYLSKFAGTGAKNASTGTLDDALFSAGGSLIGIACVTAATHFWLAGQFFYTMVIGSFGASAVLLFCGACVKAPLAQPRNVIGGHVVSALWGCLVHTALDEHLTVEYTDWWWLAGAVSVSGAIFLMILTKTVHPPGGATALIAILGKETNNLGWGYVFCPVAAGACVLTAVAILWNNLHPGRSYPNYWW